MGVLVPLLLLVALGACASGGGGGGEGQRSDVINEEELRQYANAPDLEQLIDQARPRWFATDRIQSFNMQSGILVYEDSNLLGRRDILSQISPSGIIEIRWLNSSQAGTLPGAGDMHVEGAIVITRR